MEPNSPDIWNKKPDKVKVQGTKVQGTKIFHEEENEKCEACGFDMIELTACHMRCPNCGFERTCSDI